MRHTLVPRMEPYATSIFGEMSTIAAETGARAVYLPMLLGAVFKATGNASPVSVPA